MGFGKISPNEAFESLQITLPVIITYVGAIVGFSFNPSQSHLLESLEKEKGKQELQEIIRPLVSMILTFGLLGLLLLLTLFFVFDLITFDGFKKSVASVTWSLTGLTSFIIGKYFGKEVIVTENEKRRPKINKS